MLSGCSCHPRLRVPGRVPGSNPSLGRVSQQAHAAGVAANFSRLVAQQRRLDHAQSRAFWINPGYEWTPTLQRGRATFQLSQKLLLFGLVGLNENRAVPANVSLLVAFEDANPINEIRRRLTVRKQSMKSAKTHS